MRAPFFTEGQKVVDYGHRDQGAAKVTKPGKYCSVVTYSDGRKATIVNTRLELVQDVVTAAVVVAVCYGPLVAGIATYSAGLWS